MLRWVVVSLDRWELRRGARPIGSLVRLPASQWAQANGFGDSWAPLSRGGKYLGSSQRIASAARILLLNFGVAGK